MKNIFFSTLFLFSLSLLGQNNQIGIKGGLNMTNVTTKNFLNDNIDRTGYSCGLTYEHLFKKGTLSAKGHPGNSSQAFGLDIIYTQRGFENDIIFTDNYGNPTGIKRRSFYNYDYISIPIKVGFNIGNKLYFFTNIGACPSILIKATTETPSVDAMGNVTGTATFDVTANVSKFDFAAFAEMGIGFKFKDRLWLFSSFTYQRSFTTISNTNYFAGSKILHYGKTISIGLKYSLKKE